MRIDKMSTNLFEKENNNSYYPIGCVNKLFLPFSLIEELGKNSLYMFLVGSNFGITQRVTGLKGGNKK
jgi:hypothetical protein